MKKRTNILSILLLLVMALVMTACQPSIPKEPKEQEDKHKTADQMKPEDSTFPVTVKHVSGETTIEKAPERLVVPDMATLDIIDALGLGDKVVGTVTSMLPKALEKYKNVTNVGSAKELDMEAVAKLQPDLVFIGNRMSKHYEEYSKNWTVVNASVPWTDVAEGKTYSDLVPENIVRVATAVGKKAEGEAMAKEITDLMAKYKGMAKDKGSALVLMSNGGEISMHGPQSRWAPIFDLFGFTNAGAEKQDEGHKGQKISFETVKELDPDYIFVVDRDAAVGKTEAGVTAQAVLDNELVASTKAFKNGHIVYLSPQEWYIVMTGYNNFKTILNEVADSLK